MTTQNEDQQRHARIVDDAILAGMARKALSLSADDYFWLIQKDLVTYEGGLSPRRLRATGTELLIRPEG